MIKCTYFWSWREGIEKGPNDWLDEAREHERGLTGLVRSAWWEVRTAPQPKDVRRSLSHFAHFVETWWDSEGSWREQHEPFLDREIRGSDRVGDFFVHLSDPHPQYDLIRDVPAAHYPHMARPLDWSAGHRPVVPEPDGHDMWRYVYFFNYRDGVPLDDGEDWYLGHHTREGKQLPGLVHYVTWRRRGPSHELAGLADEARRFVRYTELCFEDFDTWHKVCYREGPRWTMSEVHGGVWGDYQQLFLGPTPYATYER